jgi:hypothetical protein
LSALDSANHFNVRALDLGDIAFSIFQEVEGKKWELRAQLDPELALNLAVWLTAIADPEGEKFIRLYHEVTKAQ